MANAMRRRGERRGDPWAPVVPDLPAPDPEAAAGGLVGAGGREAIELAEVVAAAGGGHDLRLIGVRLARLRVVA